MSLRQVVLDTETTGMSTGALIYQGHNIIEIGAIELINRRAKRSFQCYIKPTFPVSEAAFKVHGITQAFLQDKPSFPEILPALLAFIDDAELIMHNAKFDVAFLNAELERAQYIHPRYPDVQCTIAQLCTVTDTLLLARKKFPGRSNSLDALCKRFQIDLTQRTLHGALLDAQLLVDVFLALTEGQGVLGLETRSEAEGSMTALGKGLDGVSYAALQPCQPFTGIVEANSEEKEAHESLIATIKMTGSDVVWKRD